VQSAKLRPGDAVRIRGERWRVAAESPYNEASILEVQGCDVFNRGIRARFILPFEPLESLPASSASLRVVGVARWRREARARLAAAVPHWTSLRAAARSQLTIIPFQLEPALAMTRGDGCRFLIADDVGLGKTIQAGLIVAEAIVRTPDARVLIVAPAGLRDQWRDELQSRFALRPELLDAGGIARAGTHLGPDVNPWSVHPIAIASIDYIKRPDVMRSLEPLLWDVIVFDEAHTLSGRSDRAAAAAGLAARSRCVVMLTATPHPGDDDTFARLCDLGDLGGDFPLISFRRTRADIGLPHGRRSIVLRVRPTTAELAMHAALADYTRQLASHSEGSVFAPAARLVATILTRRAHSSAGSLTRSLERRIALLAENVVSDREQLALPFVSPDDDDEPGAELGVAGLGNVEEETRWLDRLLSLSRDASQCESKLQALQRLLRRANQSALVFTEYRDTLGRLAGVLADFNPQQLHGGLTGSERRRALRHFDEVEGGLLLATDAASEGLNLQHRCRLVVNLEVPWTPTRLEQRVGRVDRFGQRRRVHAVQLVAAGSSEEAGIGNLVDRSGRILAALDTVRNESKALPSPLRPLAEAEAERLRYARALSNDLQEGVPADRPVLAFARARGNTRRCTWAFRLPILDADGHLVFETIVGLNDARGLAIVDDALEQVAALEHQRILAVLSTSLRPWRLTMTHREEAMADALRLRHARIAASVLQPGLFDRRTERAATAQTFIVEAAVKTSIARLALLDRLQHLYEDGRAVAFGIAFR
jgi:superfamily II DNA or RNA helicase